MVKQVSKGDQTFENHNFVNSLQATMVLFNRSSAYMNPKLLPSGCLSGDVMCNLSHNLKNAHVHDNVATAKLNNTRQ